MSNQGSESGAVRYFTGEAEDGKEYRRWKIWCKNKLLTMDKLPEASRGAFIYTLLSGKALEAVEHLEPETYQKSGGDKTLWNLLDARFPEKETVDQLGEILTEVFALRSQEGETMKVWVARASEVFDRCQRKTGVTFPEEARGWILLHRAGLNEEQKAVVIARSGGSLKREALGMSLRSCYPELVISKKKTVAAVEEVFPVEDMGAEELEDHSFQDVQGLLEDHQLAPLSDNEQFQEGDVAEVLAASWKERRQELNRLQKNRQFKKAGDVRRSFRVEVEELKARTSCHRCGKRGHWTRECPMPPPPKGAGKGKAGTASSSASGASGAGMVVEEPHFVAMVTEMIGFVEEEKSLLDRVRELSQARNKMCARCGQKGHWRPECPNLHEPMTDQPEEVALVSCPGFGVLDSGCGRTIIGAQTLLELEKLLVQRGLSSPESFSEIHQFKFGNGAVETSHQVVALPVWLAGRRGVIKASVVKGAAPLLISRAALKKLGAQLDFQNDKLLLFGSSVPLQVNGAGQYVVSLFEEPSEGKDAVQEFAEIMTVGEPSDEGSSQEESSADVHSQADDRLELEPEIPVAEPMQVHVWVQEDSGVSVSPHVSKDGLDWKQVVRRVIRDAKSRRVLQEVYPNGSSQKTVQFQLPKHVTHVISEFFYHGEKVKGSTEHPEPCWNPSMKQARQLNRQLKVCHDVCEVRDLDAGRLRLMEVFSPPSFCTSGRV